MLCRHALALETQWLTRVGGGAQVGARSLAAAVRVGQDLGEPGIELAKLGNPEPTELTHPQGNLGCAVECQRVGRTTGRTQAVVPRTRQIAALFEVVRECIGNATLTGLGLPDRAHVLREAIYCCRKAGTVSVPGVYVGMIDKLPFGAAMNKGLTIKSGQTHVQKYMRPLLKMIENEKIDPSAIITHRLLLRDAPAA